MIEMTALVVSLIAAGIALIGPQGYRTTNP